MSDILWVGDAPEVAQVSTGTIDTYDAAGTYTVTINGKTVSVAGDTNENTTATNLRAALNASTIPEFAEITWSGATDAIIGTADTPGKPFTAVLSASGGSAAVTDFSTTTANSGPNACIAANFKNVDTNARALPVDSDNLWFQDSDVSLLYALDAISGVTLANLYVKASYEGQIGLPAYNTDGDDQYAEYRPRFLVLEAATNCQIGEGDGDGSARLQLDLSAGASAVTVWKTNSPAETSYHALIIKGTSASNTLTVKGGSVDVAPFDDDVATFATVVAAGEAEVRLSSGCTLTTIIASGQSVVDIGAAFTTLTQSDSATVTRRGSGASTTINATAGILNEWGSGTVTNMNVGDGATVDASGSPVAKTWTNTTVAGAFTINDAGRKVTFTNAISAGQGSVLNGTLNIGNGRTLLPGAP